MLVTVTDGSVEFYNVIVIVCTVNRRRTEVCRVLSRSHERHSGRVFYTAGLQLQGWNGWSGASYQE